MVCICLHPVCVVCAKVCGEMVGDMWGAIDGGGATQFSPILYQTDRPAAQLRTDGPTNGSKYPVKDRCDMWVPIYTYNSQVIPIKKPRDVGYAIATAICVRVYLDISGFTYSHIDCTTLPKSTMRSMVMNMSTNITRCSVGVILI